MKPRICVNCGATLHSNKCEYCDTEYVNTEAEREISILEQCKREIEKQIAHDEFMMRVKMSQFEYPPSKTTIERIEEWRKEMRKKWGLE